MTILIQFSITVSTYFLEMKLFEKGGVDGDTEAHLPLARLLFASMDAVGMVVSLFNCDLAQKS